MGPGYDLYFDCAAEWTDDLWLMERRRSSRQRSNDAPSTGSNPALIRTQRPGGASAPAPPDAGQNQEAQ